MRGADERLARQSHRAPPGLPLAPDAPSGTCGAADLAILYSDQSVLEMHHLASAFQLLKEPQCDVMSTFSDEARRQMRSRIVGMVLATDLSVNFPTINAFKQMVSEKSSEISARETPTPSFDALPTSPPLSAERLASLNAVSASSTPTGAPRPSYAGGRESSAGRKTRRSMKYSSDNASE